MTVAGVGTCLTRAEELTPNRDKGPCTFGAALEFDWPFVPEPPFPEYQLLFCADPIDATAVPLGAGALITSLGDTFVTDTGDTLVHSPPL